MSIQLLGDNKNNQSLICIHKSITFAFHLLDMKLNKYFVIDFDSTFTKVEALDVLADISLSDHPEKEDRKAQIIKISNQGMDGSISFRESLERRLNLLAPSKTHLPFLITKLKG